MMSSWAKGGGYALSNRLDHTATFRTLQEIFQVPLLYSAKTGTNLSDLFKPTLQLSEPSLTTSQTIQFTVNGLVPGKTNYFQFTTNLDGTNPVTWQNLLTNVLVIEALKAPSNAINWTPAAQTVMLLGSHGAPAIPFLISALQDTNQSILGLAVQALGRIHMQPEVSIPAIVPLLQLTNTNTWLRANALEALREFGPVALSFVPTAELIRSLNDPDGFVRERATNTLRQLDPEAAAKAATN